MGGELRSHPAWVRGLKHEHGGKYVVIGGVAPRVGAWIETEQDKNSRVAVESHPAWVRGLKHAISYFDGFLWVSHPAWVRGLKHGGSGHSRTAHTSHPAWVRGLKRWVAPLSPPIPGRTPRGCVD